MAAPIIAVFTDGEPKLLSLDALRDLIGVTDLEARLAASGATAEDRLSLVVDASNRGLQQARAELLSTFEQIEPIQLQFGPITSDISALKEAKVGFDSAIDILGRDLGAAALGISALELAGAKASIALDALGGVVADQEAAQRQASAAAGRLEEAVLRAVLENARTRDVLRDAGIIVNPTDGTVRIYAIDQLRDRTTLAEVAIDGVKGLVSTKASVNYVNEQLALAVLNPEQVAQLEPILARLTQAESQIDGLNAAVRLKASVEELTALSLRTRAAEIDVDALKGQIALTATADAVDKLFLRTTNIEQRLVALPDSAGLIVEVRQVRAAAQNTDDALLRSLAAGDIASQYQLTQIAQARQELSTRMDDGFSAAALARTQLSVRIGETQAMVLAESQASITREKALTQRIDAQGVTLGDQAAAIGRVDRAVIDAAGGVAGTQMTIRQMVGAADDTGEALLRSLATGEQDRATRAAQLVQIQTEFTTSLIAGQKSEAAAREALLARLALAEAAIVTTSKVLADTTGAYATRIAALEVAIADPVTGQAATRVRINAVEDASAKRDSALGSRIDGIEAVVNDQVTGLPATRAALTAGLKAAADRTQALSEQFVSLTAELHDPATGLAATYANIVQASKAQVDGDKALTERIDAQGVTLGNQAAAIGRIDTALINAAGGIAGTQMTIRQMVGAADDTGEALLRSLAAGEQDKATRAAQLVQIQTEFTTTLIEGKKSEALAREALLARMAQAESAIVTTSKVVSDLNQALASRIVALEAAFNDAATGVLATRARIIALEEATAKADAAAARRLDLIEGSVNDPLTGLTATRATVAQDREASATRDSANARDIQQLAGQVNDPATGLPATAAGLAQERTVSAERDAARSREIQVLSAQVNDPGTGLPAVSATVASNKQAQVDGDKALGESLQQVTTTLNGQTASINLLLRTIDGKEAVAQLTVDVNGKISGFRVNGKDSTFAIAADKFIVGASQIFEVDATTGVTRIRNAVIGTATIDTLNIRGGALSSTKTDIQSVNGVSASAAQSSDTTTFEATGGTIRIDVCVQPTRTATGTGALRVQLFSSDGRALSGQYKCPSAADSAPVTFMAIDNPAAGSRGYYVAYSVDSANGGATYNASHLIVLTELKR
ncbi:hypothetical protein ACWGNZ_00620 [Sphingomonas zeae]